MSFIPLTCHPATPGENIRCVAVRPRRNQGGMLSLEYRIEGNLAGVRWPSPRPSRRADGLWKHTCFEVFLAEPGRAEYFEFNFAPSTEWTCYRFEAYREGRSVVEHAGCPTIVLRAGADRFELEATVDLNALSPDLAGTDFRLAASAVIEETSGGLSYWALRHPPGRPDFHHPDSFALMLDPF